jgi:hypothetical protein
MSRFVNQERFWRFIVVNIANVDTLKGKRNLKYILFKDLTRAFPLRPSLDGLPDLDARTTIFTKSFISMTCRFILQVHGAEILGFR